MDLPEMVYGMFLICQIHVQELSQLLFNGGFQGVI